MADEDVEALRRRLYAPGATDDDRRRYAATGAPDPGPVPDAPAPGPPRRRRRGPLLAVAVLLVAVGAAAGVGRLAAPAPSPTRSAVAPTAGVVTGSARRVPLDVAGYAAVAERLDGVGEARVPLDTAAAPRPRGRLVVLLVSADRRAIGWRALRFGRVGDARSVPLEIGSGPARPRGGTPTVDTADYAGGPPHALQVRAAPGVRWRLTAVLVPQETGLH